MIAGSATLVWLLPRSVLAFMAFQASLLVVYLVPLSVRAKLGYTAVTLGFGEVIRVLSNNLDKPWNVTNGPRCITPIQRPPLFFDPLLRTMGIQASPFTLYPLYFYFLVLAIVVVVFVVNRRLEGSHVG